MARSHKPTDAGKLPDVPSAQSSGVPEGGTSAARLADLQSLTDSTLTQLDVDSLLVELLVRVREIVDVDTAAVLTLDPQSDELVARAACGIEDEVRQGVRVPLGAGLAGRVAATKDVVRLDHVDATTVTNPILWERGIKVMLGVPLLSDARVLGVLHVGRLEARPFDDDDVTLLRVVGDRIAAALQTRQLAIERAATGLLERSLLPSSLPKCPGLSFATRYVAAEDRAVGGDWYDVFMSPTEDLWIVVGDVAGHGLQSAVIMGRIRSALRAYTLLEVAPEHVLELVDRKVRHFEIDTFATVACGVVPPPYDSMTLAIAGHPPPVLAVPGQPATFLEVDAGAPIGVGTSTERHSTTVELGPGAVVALYTDGLVERREESIDVGLERLRVAVTAGEPHNVARDIMRGAIGSHIPEDDVALVVMSRGKPTS